MKQEQSKRCHPDGRQSKSECLDHYEVEPRLISLSYFEAQMIMVPEMIHQDFDCRPLRSRTKADIIKLF